jgi:hypothetical protein
MARKSTFVKGSTTYICVCCGHNTRWTGEQGVGSKLCPICWDLAGYENMVQDGDMDDETGNHVTSLFLELKAKRTPEQYAKALKSCDLLEAYYPGEDEDFGVEAMPAELEAEIDANKSARNGAVEICRNLFKMNPEVARKDFVAQAVALGVCKATAGTQYNRIKKEAK